MPSRTYQNRSCKPEEVAGVALFLSSEGASHIVGHNMVGAFKSSCPVSAEQASYQC